MCCDSDIHMKLNKVKARPNKRNRRRVTEFLWIQNYSVF